MTEQLSLSLSEMIKPQFIKCYSRRNLGGDGSQLHILQINKWRHTEVKWLVKVKLKYWLSCNQNPFLTPVPLQRSLYTTAASHREVKFSWDQNSYFGLFLSVKVPIRKAEIMLSVWKSGFNTKTGLWSYWKSERTKRSCWSNQILETSGRSYYP